MGVGPIPQTGASGKVLAQGTPLMSNPDKAQLGEIVDAMKAHDLTVFARGHAEMLATWNTLRRLLTRLVIVLSDKR